MKGKLIAINTNIKKISNYNLTLYLKKLEKELTKLKTNRSMEIIKIRAVINKTK